MPCTLGEAAGIRSLPDLGAGAEPAVEGKGVRP